MAALDPDAEAVANDPRSTRRRSRGAFPDFELEVFEERHHFDPPHRIEPERLARSLEALWRRAEASSESAQS